MPASLRWPTCWQPSKARHEDPATANPAFDMRYLAGAGNAMCCGSTRSGVCMRPAWRKPRRSPRPPARAHLRTKAPPQARAHRTTRRQRRRFPLRQSRRNMCETETGNARRSCISIRASCLSIASLKRRCRASKRPRLSIPRTRDYPLAAGVARGHAVTALIQAAAKDRLLGNEAARARRSDPRPRS